jgi:ribose transport system ATP-binding protein
MQHITKEFPGVVALNDVTFEAELGKVTALVGENGAGKSTLIKIIAGVHTPNQGEIYIDGNKMKIAKSKDAMDIGINVIYQELNIFNKLSITENIFMGREKKKGIFIDQNKKTEELLKTVGLDVSPNTKMRDLSTAQKQMVEVARALAFNAKIIIMDEPTSSLTETETRILLNLIKELKKKDVGIVYVSHRIEEVVEIADKVVVLRDGELVSVLETDQIDRNRIINLMVGREVNEIFAKRDPVVGDVVLRVENLSSGFVKDVSFELRSGEVLGFAGLVGAGRSEIMRALFGLDKKDTGKIYIEGKEVSINSAADAVRHRIGFLPEDRKELGLILNMNIVKNTSLAYLKALRKGLFIQQNTERSLTLSFIESLDIRTPSELQLVKNLSGGNQQKVVIAKWMCTNPQILILDEPTRGIDVGAKKEIYDLINRLAQEGVALILISSELTEVLGMSDRVIVMHEGVVKGEIMADEATQEKIMHMAFLKNGRSNENESVHV